MLAEAAAKLTKIAEINGNSSQRHPTPVTSALSRNVV
jgi:hypothetical protein